MRLIGYEEIQSLLGMTPNTPDNAQLIDALRRLELESSIIRFPYSYTAAFGVLAPAATLTVNITIDAAAPFLIVNQTYHATTADAVLTNATRNYPNVSVLLTDTGSNRQMMDVAVPIPNIFGDGQFPYILPEPKLMAANSVLSCQITSFEAAVNQNIDLTFSGYKLYSLRR